MKDPSVIPITVNRGRPLITHENELERLNVDFYSSFKDEPPDMPYVFGIQYLVDGYWEINLLKGKHLGELVESLGHHLPGTWKDYSERYLYTSQIHAKEAPRGEHRIMINRVHQLMQSISNTFGVEIRLKEPFGLSKG